MTETATEIPRRRTMSTGDSTDDSVTPDDNDGDMICDALDTDDGNNGYTDVHETAAEPTEWSRTTSLTSMATGLAMRWTRTTTAMAYRC